MKAQPAQNDPTFSDFWAAYPRRRKKLDAEKAWKQAVKRGVKPEAIMASLELMLRTEWKRRKPEYLPYPASFLRGEAFEDERTEAIEDDEQPAVVTLRCVECDPPHDWPLTEEMLKWKLPRDGRMPCPVSISEAIERMKGQPA